MFTWKLTPANPFPELDGGSEPGNNLRPITKANAQWTLGLPAGKAVPWGQCVLHKYLHPKPSVFWLFSVYFLA